MQQTKAAVALTPPADVLARRAALKGLFFGGEWRQGKGRSQRHVYAARHDVTFEFRLASAEDMRAAITAADAARDGWRRTEPAHRAALLLRLADLVETHGEELARLQTLDTGQPLVMARQMIPTMSAWIRYYASWIDKATGSTMASAANGRWIVVREPYGVVGILLPWNMPISAVCMKSMAALAAGNCMVVKTPEIAPFGMMRFAELFEEAGFPPGVIGVLPADGEGGEALSSDPRIAKLSFTGGAPTAAKVIAASAANVTPGLYELGGKSACLLFEDADLDAAVPFACHIAMGAAGQVCIAGSRLLVQRSIYEEVVSRAAAVFGTMTLGDPFDPVTVMGPVVSAASADRIVATIERARREGPARLVCGGRRGEGDFAAGAYVEPALFADVPPHSHLFQEEVFGPVLAITPFTDEAEAITLANGTAYGLYAYVFTRDYSRALRLADRMEAGSVAVNGFGGVLPSVPFGGFGTSGYGKEGGREGFDEFLRTKAIFLGA